jgi:hypothetical protein
MEGIIMSVKDLLEKSERVLDLQRSLEKINYTLDYFKNHKDETLPVSGHRYGCGWEVTSAFKSGDVDKKVTKYFLTQIRKRKKEIEAELKELAS